MIIYKYLKRSPLDNKQYFRYYRISINFLKVEHFLYAHLSRHGSEMKNDRSKICVCFRNSRASASQQEQIYIG